MGITSRALRTAFSTALRRAYHCLLCKRPLTASAAQSCNDDVLELIFSHMKQNDLTSLALTCKRWSPAAYRALYACVAFSPYFKDIILMEKLAPTLIASENIRHLIRRVELTCLEGIVERPSPDPLYDWVPLLPSDTVLSLEIYTDRYLKVDGARFMDTLLRSPMLNSIRHLSMTNGDAFFEDVNRMSQLLMLTPNVSYLSVDLPNTRGHYAPFTPIPCRVRHLAVWMFRYTPLLGELLKVTHGSLETLLCHTADAHHFQDEFGRAREMTFSSPIQTLLFFNATVLEGRFPLLSIVPGSWPKLRELVLGGWRMQWDALTSQLPSSLETLVVDWTFFDEFPFEQLTSFVKHVPTSHPAFSRLVICNVGRRSHQPFSNFATTCVECGVLLRLYGPSIRCPSIKDSWTLDAMLKNMDPALL